MGIRIEMLDPPPIEYMAVLRGSEHHNVARLNKHGALGWDFAFVLGDYIYLKRVKVDSTR